MPTRAQYGRVEMPAVANPMSSLADVVNMVSGLERMSAQSEGVKSKQAIEKALGQSQNNLTMAIKILEDGGRWSEAQLLKSKEGEIQKGKLDELASSRQLAVQNLTLASRYVQPIVAEKDPAKRAALFGTMRPQLLELMPDLAQYIPETLDADPEWPERALTIGQTSAEFAQRQQAAATKAKDLFEEKGKHLIRDKDAFAFALPFLQHAQSGEEVQGVVDQMTDLFDISPLAKGVMLRDVVPGPLPQGWGESLASRMTSQPAEREPASFDAAILAAQRAGNQPEVDRLITLQGRVSAASRAPQEPRVPTVTSQQEVPVGVQRWLMALRQEQVWKPNPKDTAHGGAMVPITYDEAQRRLAEEIPNLSSVHPNLDPVKVNNALRSLFQPDPVKQNDALIGFLNSVRNAQGGTGTTIPATTTPPATVAPATPARPAAQAAIPTEVSTILAGKPTGTHTLSDGSRWHVTNGVVDGRR